MPVRIDDPLDPITNQDIDAFEEANNVKVPAEYREFLLQHNGGKSGLDVFDFVERDSKTSSLIRRFLGIHDGHSYSINHALEVYRGRIPFCFLPIGKDPFGNLICSSFRDEDAGAVYFWDHEMEANDDETPETAPNIHRITSSFQAFVDCLYE